MLRKKITTKLQPHIQETQGNKKTLTTGISRRSTLRKVVPEKMSKMQVGMVNKENNKCVKELNKH